MAITLGKIIEPVTFAAIVGIASYGVSGQLFDVENPEYWGFGAAGLAGLVYHPGKTFIGDVITEFGAFTGQDTSRK